MVDKTDVTETRYDGPYLVSQTSQTRTGYRGPRHYNKFGGLAANAVVYSKTSKICRNRKWTPTGGTVSPVDFHQPGWFLSRAGISVQRMKDDAAIQFYSKLANTNALLPLMFIERQSTVDMVSEKVMKLVAMKRKFLKEVRKSWKGNDHKIVQQRWLEYRYGWIPTLMDIDTLVNQPLGLPGTKVEGRSFARYDERGAKLGEAELNQNGFMSCRVQSLVLPKDPFMKTASQYGIANPALVAWELVPYSFVVDWVFNIGGYLEHLGALSGLELIGPTTSIRQSFHQESYTPSRGALSSSYGSFKGVTGERSLGVPPYPNPFIPTNGLNLYRFFDAAALLKGQFDRFRR